MEQFKGMRQDTHESKQPQETYRYAKNLVASKLYGSLANERGTLVSQQLNATLIIGICPLKQQDYLVFSLNSTNVPEIGIVENNVYRTVIADTVLNFSKDHPIKAEYEYDFNGNAIVAFTDNYNPIRFLNINCLPFDLNPDYSLVDPANIDLLNMIPGHRVPEIGVIEQQSSGILRSGVYQFCIAYVLEDGSELPWTPLCNPILVNDEDRTDKWHLFDGLEPVPGTTVKSLYLGITNLDDKYSTFKLGVVHTNDGVSSAYKLDGDYTISGTPLYTILVTGFESWQPLTLAEVITPPVNYKLVKTLSNLQKRLFIGNLTTDEDINYQQYACAITSEWITKDVGLNEVVDSYKNEVTCFFDRSFMADEAYAFYIAFLKKDGTRTSAYHIPGRIPVGTEAAPETSPYLQSIDPTALQFEFRNQSAAGGVMGVWVNATEVYPNDPDFDGSISGEDLRGQKVRHHRFPSLNNLWNYGNTVNNAVDGEWVCTIDPLTSQFQDPIPPYVQDTIDVYMSANLVDWASTGSSFGTPILGGPDVASYNVWQSTYDQEVLIDIDLYLFTEITNILSLIPPDVIANYERDEYFFTLEILNPDNTVKTVLMNTNVSNDVKTTILNLVPLPFSGTAFNDTRYTESALPTPPPPTSNKKIIFKDNVYLLAGEKIKFSWHTISHVDRLVLCSGTDHPYYGTIRIKQIHSETNDNSTPSNYTAPILGIKFNVPIPDFIKDQCQSFEIFYAKPTLENKRVIDQSLLYPDALKTFVNGAIEPDRWIFEADEAARFHGFSTLKNKPAFTPSFVKRELFYQPDTNVWTSAYIDYTPWNYAKLDTSECKYVKNNLASPYPDIDREEYYRLKFDITDPIVLNTWNNEPVISTLGLPLCNIVSLKKDLYKPFYDQPLVSTGLVYEITPLDTVVVHETYGGDIFKTLYSPRLTLSHDPSSGPQFGVGTLDTPYYNEKIDIDHIVIYEGYDRKQTFITESQSNIYQRHSGTQYNEKYYPRTNMPYTISFPTGVDKFDITNSTLYNKDYSKLNELRTAFPWKSYTLCSELTNRFPYRVARSVVQSDESRVINWRKFLATDYYEMPRNKGTITHLQAWQAIELIIHHEYSMFKTQSQDNLKTLDDLTISIGTSDIFARQPDEVYSIDGGYAGNQNQHCSVLTKAGYFFVDAQYAKVFLFDGKLNELSNMGLRQFFREWMGTNVDNPFNLNGLTACFDEENNRIVYTNNNPEVNHTVSYTLDNQSWTSFHDYYPRYLFAVRNKMLSVQNGNIYSHDGKYGEFYGTIYPSFIDAVFNVGGFVPKLFNNFNWNTVVLKDDKVPLFNHTFDYITVWNDYMCSGKIELEEKVNLFSFANIRHRESEWSFNKFRDLVVRRDLPFLKGFLQDYRPLETNIDANKPFYMKRLFHTNFVVVRFEYANLDNHLLLINNLETELKPSYR